MFAAFPPLDHRPPAASPPAVPARPDFGEEARTAGPMPGRYVPESKEKISHSADVRDVGADAAVPPRGASFDDVLDTVNPLHHIPVVGMIYRGLSGDTIGGAAQIIGGALFGGPIGAIAGVASAIISRQTGQSPSEVVVSALNGDAPARRAAQTYVDLSAPPVKRYNFNLKA